MEQFEVSNRTKVKRVPKRGVYEHETVYQILDEGKVCHISFVHEGHPVVIPTTYGRAGDQLFIHGAQTSRMLVNLEQGLDIALAITLIDGLVLARSVFHHSMNYRSVVIFGKASEVIDPPEKMEALKVITNHLVPGRWEEARQPSAKEIKGTKVLKVGLSEVSAKVRTGGPVDEKEDYSLPIWAGEIPLDKNWGAAIADPLLEASIPIPDSVQGLHGKK